MDLIREGSEFQAEGPAIENALLASFVLVLGWEKEATWEISFKPPPQYLAFYMVEIHRNDGF